MKKSTFAKLAITAILALGTQAWAMRIVIDNAGNPVEVADTVSKIANAWTPNNQIIAALAPDKLVATTQECKDHKWFVKMFPQIAQLPVIASGGTVDIDAVVSLNPDVLIVDQTGDTAELRDKYHHVINSNFKGVDNFKSSVNLLAEIAGGFGMMPKAREFEDYVDANIKLVKDKIDQLKSEVRPKVLHIVDNSNLLRVDGKGSAADDWIAIAGGTNAITKEGTNIEVTAEDIIAADPDVIIVGGQNSGVAIGKIYSDATFGESKAVRTRQVFANPTGVSGWDTMSMEIAMQVLWAAKIIHPEEFSDVDIAATAKEFYQKWMNYEPSDKDIEKILQGLDP